MRYLSILVLVCFLLTGFTAQKLKTFKIGTWVSAMLPADFQVMPDDMIARKYPAPRKPLGAFSSPNGQVDFIVSERPSTFKAEDLGMLQQFYRSTITNKYSEVNFIREEIQEINRQKYLVFEFTSAMRDEGRSLNKMSSIRKYTLIQYTIVPDKTRQTPKNPEQVRDKDLVTDKLLVFTFNAPVELKDTWQEIARKIMQTIKLN